MWFKLRQLVVENWKDWTGTDQQGPMRQYARSAGGMLRLFFVGREEGIVCLCARSARSRSGVLSELQTLQFIHSRCEPSVSDFVPRSLGVIYESSSEFVGAETMLPGRSMAPTHNAAKRRRHLLQMAEFIGELHRQTCEAHCDLDDKFFELHLRAELERNLTIAGLANSNEWASRIRQLVSVMSGTLPLVLRHGDLHSGNILLSRAGEVTGVADWERCKRRGLPFVDWYFFLISYMAGLAPKSSKQQNSGILAAYLIACFYDHSPFHDDLLDATRRYCHWAGVDPALAGPMFDLFALMHLDCVLKYCMGGADGSPHELQQSILHRRNVFHQATTSFTGIRQRSKAVDLTISIVNHHNRELLKHCLESIFGNTHRVSTEVYVVDNASTDGSSEMVREEFPQVNLLINAEHLGFSANHNQVLGRAAGRHTLILNEDTVIQAGALDKMVEFMDEHPESGALGCLLLNKDGTIQPSCFEFYTLRSVFFDYCLAPEGFNKDAVRGVYRPDALKQTATVDWVCGACLLLRNDAVKEVGFLDEGLYMYSEEVDWCYRARQKGWKVFFVPEARVVHYGGQATRHESVKMFALLCRSRYFFFKKHYGLINGYVLRALLLLGTAWNIWFLLLRFLLRRIDKKELYAGTVMFWNAARFSSG